MPLCLEFEERGYRGGGVPGCAPLFKIGGGMLGESQVVPLCLKFEGRGWGSPRLCPFVWNVSVMLYNYNVQ